MKPMPSARRTYAIFSHRVTAEWPVDSPLNEGMRRTAVFCPVKKFRGHIAREQLAESLGRVGEIDRGRETPIRVGADDTAAPDTQRGVVRKTELVKMAFIVSQ